MKKQFVLFLVTMSFFFLLGCASVSVVTDHDPEEDFSKLKTFKIYDGAPLPGDMLAKNPLVKKRFEEAIKEELVHKGFTYQESGEVDFMVVAHADVKEKVQVTNWGRYHWYDPWWGPYGGHVDVSHYEEGTLVFDIVDMAKKELVWRGMGTRVLGSRDFSNDEKGMKNIREIVARILGDFPPKK